MGIRGSKSSNINFQTFRAEINRYNIMIKCIGCLIYDTSKQMFLLQQRSKQTTQPMKLGLWGGKMESAESFSDALHRELTEELGNMLPYLKFYPLDTYLGTDNKFLYYSFLMIVENFDNITINPRETFDYIWLPFHYIERLNLHSGFRKTFETKKDYIQHIIDQY